MTANAKSTKPSSDEWTKRIKKRIASGSVHLDRDGWWIDDKTGEPIGPDPEMERELSAEELARADVYQGETLVRRGRPPSEAPKQVVTIRLDADLVAKLRASGKGWQTRVNSALRKAEGLQ
jgi:uncharacterized protein (DUF4415 family)